MIEFDLGFNNLACEPEVTYQVNRELNLAWEIVEETGANLFLTGRAGTGKTTFLKRLREKTGKRLVVLAPTGVAAINASGTTLHSFFQLPFAPYLPGKGFLTSDKSFRTMSKQKKRLISSLSLLVIDEISMVRPDTLDAIDFILRHIRHSSAPFGGVQLLLIGDIRQLPPVVRDDEWQQLSQSYPTPYFFESHALKSAGFLTVELSTVYRQADRVFLDILNSIRDGKADRNTLSILNSRLNPGFNPTDDEGYIRLTTHNRIASSINDNRLSAIVSPQFSFHAEVEGEFPESAFPAEKTLRLKKGAQVMFIKNDTGAQRRFYNGMIGIVTELSDEKICVSPHQGGETIEVERMEWENTRFLVDASDGNVAQETIGVFRQYPLQLAWAITIHKSQGLTFDRAIIDAMHSFAPGQTYVALSRCRSLEGLVLESPVPPEAVITDNKVTDFVDYYENHTPGTESIARLKNDYAFTLLSELFDFEAVRRSYDDFCRYALEYLVPPFPELESKLLAWKKEIEDNLKSVSGRFLQSYRSQSITEKLVSPESHLKDRIRKGCVYFRDIMLDLEGFLCSMPRDIDNRGYAERLNNTYSALMDIVKLKIGLLSHLSKTSFSIASFINAKALATMELETDRLPQSRSPKKKDNPKPKKEKKPKGYSTFETLRLFKEGKSIDRIAEERGLKPATIEGHIAELITLERLNLDEVADASTLLEVQDIVSKNPEVSLSELLQLVADAMSRKYVPAYIGDYIRRLRTR